MTEALVHVLNAVGNALGALLAGAVAWAPPWLALLLLSLPFTVIGLLVFRWTTPQAKVRRAKARAKAHLLAVLLFRRDPALAAKSLALAFAASLGNLRFLAVPLLVLAVPFGLLFVQIDLRFGYRGFAPGEAGVLRVHLGGGVRADDVTAEGTGGVVVETPGVRVADPARGLSEVDFRVRATAPGRHEVVVGGPGGPWAKRVVVGGCREAVSDVRGRAGFAALLAPAERPLPEGGPAALEIAHPAALVPFLGIDWAWWLLFLVYMVPGLYVLKRPLRVEF